MAKFGDDHLGELRAMINFSTIVNVIETLCNFNLTLEGEAGKKSYQSSG